MRLTIKLGFAAFLAVAALFLPQYPASASEQIKTFSSDITINGDASLDVVEVIAYDFGAASRHGIFRDLPVSYKTDGGSREVDISGVSVTDEKGAAQLFSETRTGSLKKIKIGNPDVTVTGLKTYRIRYRVAGAINYFDDHDELYWNVTGNDWQVPIALASAKISVAGAASSSLLSTYCYYGKAGSKDKCGSALDLSGEPSASYSSAGLQAGQGMTAVIGFPKGLVSYIEQVPGAESKPLAILGILVVIYVILNILAPIVAFVVMYRRWRRFGRDPKVGTIIPQYDAPANISPSLVGVIVDDATTMDAYSGEIINLAIKGYLKINRLQSTVLFVTNEDFELVRLKSEDAGLKKYQQSLMQMLFKGGDSVKLSSLANKRVSEIDALDKEVNEEVVALGFFPANPEKVRNNYMGIGGLMLLGVFIGLFGLFPAGIIVMAFGYFMPVKTLAGVEAKEHLLGLKMYLSVAEKDRLEFHNAPEKDPAQFEKLLPYAIALDVTEQWAKKFEGIYQQSPSWYNDPVRPFAPVIFAQSLSSFGGGFASSGTAASSHSGLSGGGHSGGGFGGGGGGSW
ncbi:DUF2207 domain-containing protein [Candidatus Falkowbacteria bacterium]|nr:DUF2207 domain-containing protein [Candidatus Falkowbacteria bacterium]